MSLLLCGTQYKQSTQDKSITYGLWMPPVKVINEIYSFNEANNKIFIQMEYLVSWILKEIIVKKGKKEEKIKLSFQDREVNTNGIPRMYKVLSDDALDMLSSVAVKEIFNLFTEMLSIDEEKKIVSD